MIRETYLFKEKVLNMNDNNRGRVSADNLASKASVLPHETDAILEGSAPKTPEAKGGMPWVEKE